MSSVATAEQLSMVCPTAPAVFAHRPCMPGPINDSAVMWGRTLLAREHQRVRGEYEDRLRELERERQGAEEDKAQVLTCLSP